MRLNNAIHTEDVIEISGPSVVGRAPGTGAGQAGEISWPDVGLSATGYMGIFTTGERNAITPLVAGRWIRNSDRYHRVEWTDGTVWYPGIKPHLMNTVTSTDTSVPPPTSIGQSMSDGVDRKVNFRESIPDLGIVESIELIVNPADNVAAGDAIVNIIFQCGRPGYFYREVENSSSGNVVSFPANSQYYNIQHSLPLSLLSGVDNTYIIGVYVSRDGNGSGDDLLADMIVTGIMFYYISKPV